MRLLGRSVWDLALNQALQIATDFVSDNPHNVKNWVQGRIAKVLPLWSIEGLLHGFDAKVVDKNGEGAGSITIDAWHIYQPYILGYTTIGFSEAEIIEQFYENKTNKTLNRNEVKYRLLYNGMTGIALQVFENNNMEIFTYRTDLAPDDFSALDRIERYTKNIRELTDQYEIEALDIRKSGKINYTFPGIYQQEREWKYSTKGGNYCESGCTPVSATIVADYWDNHGYPKLIGTESEQTHSTMDANIQYTVDEFRKVMESYCLGKEGATLPLNISKLHQHLETRGEGRWGAKLISPSKVWKTMVENIDAQKPIILLLCSGNCTQFSDANHTVVVISYFDDPGIDKDFVIVRNTYVWSPQKTYNRKSMGQYMAVPVWPKN